MTEDFFVGARIARPCSTAAFVGADGNPPVVLNDPHETITRSARMGYTGRLPLFPTQLPDIHANINHLTNNYTMG